MEPILNNLIEAVDGLKKLLKENAKINREAKNNLKSCQEYILSILAQAKVEEEHAIRQEEYWTEKMHQEENEKKEEVDNKINTDIAESAAENITLEGEPDLDLIKEQQDSTGLN